MKFTYADFFSDFTAVITVCYLTWLKTGNESQEPCNCVWVRSSEQSGSSGGRTFSMHTFHMVSVLSHMNTSQLSKEENIRDVLSKGSFTSPFCLFLRRDIYKVATVFCPQKKKKSICKRDRNKN